MQPLNDIPSIDEVKLINGKDAAMLNQWERSIYDFYLLHGEEFGVRVTVVSEAPTDELERTNSRIQFEQILSRYPSKISVKTHKSSSKKNNGITCVKHNSIAISALLLSIVSIITSTVSIASNYCDFKDDKTFKIERYLMGVQICKNERNTQS